MLEIGMMRGLARLINFTLAWATATHTVMGFARSWRASHTQPPKVNNTQNPINKLETSMMQGLYHPHQSMSHYRALNWLYLFVCQWLAGLLFSSWLCEKFKCRSHLRVEILSVNWGLPSPNCVKLWGNRDSLNELLLHVLTPPTLISDRKRELLSREDLELPWRPLYELQDRILYSKTEHLGLNWFPKYAPLLFYQHG